MDKFHLERRNIRTILLEFHIHCDYMVVNFELQLFARTSICFQQPLANADQRLVTPGVQVDAVASIVEAVLGDVFFGVL